MTEREKAKVLKNVKAKADAKRFEKRDQYRRTQEQRHAAFWDNMRKWQTGEIR